jgi:hypothetical protein
MMIRHGLAGLASKRRAEGHGCEIKFSSWTFSKIAPAGQNVLQLLRIDWRTTFLSGQEIVVIR